MKIKMQELGIYIHVPFCAGGKCPYCDFYSVPYEEGLAARYMQALKVQAAAWSEKLQRRKVDSIYFGGGTPSVLQSGLGELLQELKTRFSVAADAEVTLEANPSSDLSCLPALHAAGFNRISIGVQSACTAELRTLGRKHTFADASRAVGKARDAGFDNLSLDLMLCTPGQTRESMMQSVAAVSSLRPRHISAYLLKVEPGTPFYENRSRLALPDDDTQGDRYLRACEEIEKRGFAQYEISNFAVPGYESRHNLKYWNCEEYLGLGPAAHSFLNNRRFYYERNLQGFLKGQPPVDDGEGGTWQEYCMLALRLKGGIVQRELKKRFGVGFEALNLASAERLGKAGFLKITQDAICMTRKGFVVSNSVIAALVFS